MNNVFPVFMFMVLVLIFPHGVFENIAMIGLLTTGAIGLRRIFTK